MRALRIGLVVLVVGIGVSARGHDRPGARVTPPGPGNGWGFPNGNPDGYGWVDYGTTIPLGADRTPEYHFRRFYTLPAPEIFFPTYYNPYITRGQRFLPYVGCGGMHPAGGPPTGSAALPVHPYYDALRQQQQRTTPTPRLSGRVEVAPVGPERSEPQP